MQAPINQDEREKYFALDCEMVGVGTGEKSALARVSVVDYDCNVVLDTFVQVPERVTDFRTHVSGVRAKDIQSNKNPNAMDFLACRKKVGDILFGKILVGHALKNDLSALMLDHPRSFIRDTATYKPLMKVTGEGGGKHRPRKLKDLAKEFLEMEIQREGEEHSPIEDAKATMEVFKNFRQKWEKQVAKKDVKGTMKKSD